MEIKPTTGFGKIRFGASKESVFDILGKGVPIGNYQNDRESYSCRSGAIHVMFQNNMGLTAIIINNQNEYSQAILWNKKVFSLSEKELIAVINAKKLDYHQERNGWGDLDITITTMGMLMGFDDEGLQSVEIYDRDNRVVRSQIRKQKNKH